MISRPDRHDVAIVGAGVIGLATAYQLLVSDQGRRVVVLEKEPGVGYHQSSHNSGVLHAGLYYTPGSLKAQLCRRGKRLMEQFAVAHDIPVVRTGKLVVAVDSSELPRFEALAQRAERNEVDGLRRVSGAQLREIEPHVAGIQAIHSPSTGAIDFLAVCQALTREIESRGGQVRTGAKVIALQEVGSVARLSTSAGDFEADVVATCAGLRSDEVAAMTGHSSDVQIVPFRGSWFALRPAAARLVQGNIYPVPDPTFPFLGVHFTRRVDGSVWAGPNAVLAGGREAYQRGSFNVRDLLGVAAFPGTWRLIGRSWRRGTVELYHDIVRRAAHHQMQRYLPELALEDLIPGPTGIRAQAVRKDGTMVDDFFIDGTRRIVHVLNAPSPGATSSLAIGEMLAREIEARR